MQMAYWRQLTLAADIGRRRDRLFVLFYESGNRAAAQIDGVGCGGFTLLIMVAHSFCIYWCIIIV